MMRANHVSMAERLEAVAAYQAGQEYRRQARLLSNGNLAEKFERHRETIARIANGKPVRNVPPDELALIRKCVAERDRLKSLAAERTQKALGEKYKVTGTTIAYWLDNPRDFAHDQAY